MSVQRAKLPDLVLTFLRIGALTSADFPVAYTCSHCVFGFICSLVARES